MAKNAGLFFLFLVFGLTITLFYFHNLIWPQTKNISPQQKTTADIAKFSLEKAPSQSKAGNILSLSGSVFWQSRIATEPARLTASVAIQQGEKIVTYDNGNITIGFGNSLLVTVSPKTELDLIQTLPTNFVFQQEQGTVSYTKIDQTPLAVRSLTLLTQIASGSANIISNKKDGLVTVEVNKGSVTVGYNDASFVSQVATIEAGKKIMFDNKVKTIKIKPLL